MPEALTLTPEQRAAREAFLRKESFRLMAVAGSGKTTTLEQMARADARRRILYVAFNRAIAAEARRRFPENTEVRTLHALAYRAVVRGPWRGKLEAGKGKLPLADVMETTLLSPLFAAVVRSTVEAFLRSGAPSPNAAHIPAYFAQNRAAAVGKRRWREEVRQIVQAARHVWSRMKDPTDPFPITHDTYVRLWRDQGGRIEGFDAVLVDEAQDLDPVFAGILERSPLQRVYVGDPRQQIYGWRGAKNALEELTGPVYPLTHAFRFGERLAAYVRWALGRLDDRPLKLHGAAPWETRVVTALAGPKTILARTNAGVVAAVLTHAEEGVHVVGGVRELVWLLEDAARLQEGAPRSRPHPELAAFQSWNELVALGEEADHPAARILSRLAENYGLLDRLARVLEHAHREREGRARVVISTVHKAKGREWDRVELADDFPAFDRGAFDPEEPHVLYVALTRAKRALAPGPVHEALLRVGEGNVTPPPR